MVLYYNHNLFFHCLWSWRARTKAWYPEQEKFLDGTQVQWSTGISPDRLQEQLNPMHRDWSQKLIKNWDIMGRNMHGTPDAVCERAFDHIPHRAYYHPMVGVSKWESLEATAWKAGRPPFLFSWHLLLSLLEGTFAFNKFLLLKSNWSAHFHFVSQHQEPGKERLRDTPDDSKVTHGALGKPINLVAGFGYLYQSGKQNVFLYFHTIVCADFRCDRMWLDKKDII